MTLYFYPTTSISLIEIAGPSGNEPASGSLSIEASDCSSSREHYKVKGWHNQPRYPTEGWP